MEIRVYDKQLNALGVIDETASLIWTIMYFAVGEVKILAPITANNKSLLQTGNVVVKHDEYNDYVDNAGTIWRRAAEITYVHYQKDENGKEQIEARGYMITRWLNQRVITPQIQMTGTQQQIVNALILRNIGSNASAKRRFPQFKVLDQETITGDSVDYSNEALKALGDEVRDQCQQGKLGYDLLVDERNKLYGFYLYKGKDLTSGNADGNPPCIFSRDFENVNEQEYEHSIENQENYAFVRGASDSNNVQLVQEVDGGNQSGLGLMEFLLDASDISRSAEDSSGSSKDIPEATYRKMLVARGSTELAGRIETYTFNSSINMKSNLRYKEDFDLGDRVTCLDRVWGITINSRITQISQTFEAGKNTIEATFGESSPTLLQVIRKKVR